MVDANARENARNATAQHLTVLLHDFDFSQSQCLYFIHFVPITA